MRARFSLLAFCAAGCLASACAPVNSKFSCNATAGDSCLTIEQVDAMTQYANGNQIPPRHFYSKNGARHTLTWYAPGHSRV